MNKNICLFIITIFVLLFSAGCSQQTGANEVDILKKQIEELENENEQLKNENHGAYADGELTESNDKANSKDAQEIKLNEIVKIDDICEFSVISSNFADKIAPTKVGAEDVYSYYEVEDSDNIFFDVAISYKNLTGTDTAACDICTGTIIYDNKYEYTSFIALEDNDGKDISSGYAPIAPLTTKIIRIASEIPVEVRDSKKAISANITLNDSNYVLNIR